MIDLREVASYCVGLSDKEILSHIDKRRRKQMVDVSIDKKHKEDSYHVRLFGKIVGSEWKNGMYSQFDLTDYDVVLIAIIDGATYYGNELNMLFRDEQGTIE